jgi:2-amino-4-hydroxy-6-hydroxymethyldihydropteridine diphosphokinase
MAEVFGVSGGGQEWVVVALGSNLGDSAGILRGAMERLKAWPKGIARSSSLWRTVPVDCPPGSPPFLNAVVGWVRSPDDNPEALLESLQALEHEFGRQVKEVRNAARRLDLDLIACGTEIRRQAQLILPHPRAAERAFVLYPLSEILPDLILPGQERTVRELRDALGEAGSLLVARVEEQ